MSSVLPATEDADFLQLMHPCTKIEQARIEQELLSGVRKPIVHSWFQKIVGDIEVYRLCGKHQIQIVWQSIGKVSREEAFIWTCENQLDRNDLPEDMNHYLIGKLSKFYIASGMRKSKQLQDTENGQDDLFPPGFTGDKITYIRTELGTKYHLSPQTVRKYEVYAGIIDELRVADSLLVAEILGGRLKVSYDHLTRMVNLDAETIQRIGADLIAHRISGKGSQLASVIDDALALGNRVKKAEPTDNTTLYQSQKAPQPEPHAVSVVSVKDMPVYDPNSDLAGLTYTIPSWVSSINRIRDQVDMRACSTQDQKRLYWALEELKQSTETVIKMILRGLL